MAHEWHAGILNASSWHGLETVGTMADGNEMIAAGERSLAWPVGIAREGLATADGLVAPVDAIVATYADARRAVVGAVGGRYRATDPDEWRGLVRAAADAGAKPTGAFALRRGSVVLATFEVGKANGLRTNMVLADSFNGDMQLTSGETTVRVVCANTLSAAMRQDGSNMARIRHTASAEEKIAILQETIAKSIAIGDSVRRLYEQAEATYLSRDSAKRAFDMFFEPVGDKTGRGATIADNARCEARRAAQLPINRVGEQRGNVATLWNAATYLVDRHVDGTTRDTRGESDLLDSILFGARAKRVETVRALVDMVLTDGSLQRMTIDQARSHGADDGAIGRRLLADMLA